MQSDLLNVKAESSEFLLGLFESDHCRYNLDVQAEEIADKEPSLTDMTAKAIELLQTGADGYFLFVEGGRIDHAHHDSRAHKALDETVEFAKAVALAISMTDDNDTLIVVSADHGHTITYAGYSVSYE